MRRRAVKKNTDVRRIREVRRYGGWRTATSSDVTPARSRGKVAGVSWRKVAVGIVIASALSGARAAHAQPSPFAPTPTDTPVVSPRAPGPPNEINPQDPAAQEALEDPKPTPPEDTRVAVGIGTRLVFGVAPAVAVGLQGSVELANSRWSVGLEGRYDLPSSGHTTQGANARTELEGASIVPCLRTRVMWACGVVLGARVAVSGADEGAPTIHDATFFLGLGARLLMHVSLPWDFALRIGGEALGHPIPVDLAVNGHSLYKSSAVSMSIGPSLVRVF